MRSHLRIARLLAVLAALGAFLLLAVGGSIKPGYSHVSQFISELNASDSPHAHALGLYGFLPLGLLVAAFLLAAAPLARVHGISRVGWWLLFSQPIAYVGVFMFPCDLGCPTQGSATQQMHNLVAVMTYIACAVGYVMLSRAPALAVKPLGRFWLVATGVLWIVGFFVMLHPAVQAWRGLLQRLLEFSLYASLLYIAWHMLEDRSI